MIRRNVLKYLNLFAVCPQSISSNDMLPTSFNLTLTWEWARGTRHMPPWYPTLCLNCSNFASLYPKLFQFYTAWPINVSFTEMFDQSEVVKTIPSDSPEIIQTRVSFYRQVATFRSKYRTWVATFELYNPQPHFMQRLALWPLDKKCLKRFLKVSKNVRGLISSNSRLKCPNKSVPFIVKTPIKKFHHPIYAPKW